MNKACKHRDTELKRLQADQQAALRLEMGDQRIPVPSSSGPFPTGSSSVDIFRKRWRQLVAIAEGAGGDRTKSSRSFSAGLAESSRYTASAGQPTTGFTSPSNPGVLSSDITVEPTYLSTSGQQADQTLNSTNFRELEPAITTIAPSELSSEPIFGPSYDPTLTVPADWSDGRTMGSGFVPWLWPDTDASVDDPFSNNFNVAAIDVNMDLDEEVNWYNWVESAKGMEWNHAEPNSNGRN